MTRFERVNLGSFASVKGGKRLPSDAAFSLVPTDHPYIRARDIGQGNIRIENPVFLTDDVVQRLRRYTVSAGDICLTIVGANVGDIGAVPKDLDGANLTENAVKIVTNGNADQKFLKYALLSDDAQAQMKVLAGGAAQPKLGIYKVETIEVPFPPLFVQRRIADILSAYDDLIENNQRRIKILEEMARSLYREWFVNFRFPGHEKVPLVDSPLRPIPKGWEVVALGELAVNVTKGTTPTTLGKEFKAEGINFFKVESIDQEGGIEESKLAKIDSNTHELLKRSQLRAGDILFSIAGAIGRTTIVPQRVLPANTNQALAIVRIPDENKRNYIFQCVRADEFQHFSLGRVVQTAQANVSLGILKSAPVVIPPKNLLGEFGMAASALMQMQENLRTRNIFLCRTRDLLLPRLLSGQICLESVG